MNASPRLRETMIESQLRTGKVLDERILEALAAVPREQFLPEKLRGIAYVDEDVEIAPGRYMLEPLVFGRMLVLADIQPTDTVLVIGALAGYSAAVMAKLAARVVAVEEQRELCDKAHHLLAKENIRNVEVMNSSHAAGYAPIAPYKVIFVEGGVQTLPQGLKDQLAQNGRLIAIRNRSQRPGSLQGLGSSWLVWKDKGQCFEREGEFDASVALVPGFEMKPQFVF